MRNYIYNGRLVFNLDDNGDNHLSFHKAVEFLKSKENISILKYYAGGWDVSYMNYKLERIELELLFRDFGGTELSTDENLCLEDLQKVRQWAEEIYNAIHNGVKI